MSEHGVRDLERTVNGKACRQKGRGDVMAERIVVLDGATLNPGDNPWTELETLGQVEVHERSTADQVLERARGATVLVVNKVKLNEDRLKELPGLRFIAVTATGYDCVDVHAARRMGIGVSNVPVYGTDAVAQHVLAMLLHVIHRVDLHDRAIRDGQWAARGDFSFWLAPWMELTGKTLGVLGFGRIGRRVAELGHALGMRVLAHTRTPKDPPSWSDFSWVDQETLACESDFLSLHCPLTAETREMINREWLSQMKPTAVLINASRGALVAEQDLADALNSGIIGAAALDVVQVEPILDTNPLLHARHCILTPHLAWSALEARQRLMRTTVDNVRAFFAGRPQNIVNP